MNFLTNIKESLGKVSNSLKSQNDGSSESSETNTFEYAGAELLMRFQSHWKAIHDENTCCAQLANECDQLVRAFQQKSKERSELMERLQSHCNNLPYILHHVHTARARLNDISTQSERLEQDLTTLQCLNIKASYAEKRRKMLQEFEGQSLVKKAQVEIKRKEQLEATRKEVERMEEEARRRVQERHETFEVEHLQQMQFYKDTGVLPVCDGLQVNSCSKSLNDMHLDLKNDDLEEFLKDDGDENSFQVGTDDGGDGNGKNDDVVDDCDVNVSDVLGEEGKLLQDVTDNYENNDGRGGDVIASDAQFASTSTSDNLTIGPERTA